MVWWAIWNGMVSYLEWFGELSGTVWWATWNGLQYYLEWFGECGDGSCRRGGTTAMLRAEQRAARRYRQLQLTSPPPVNVQHESPVMCIVQRAARGNRQLQLTSPSPVNVQR